MTQIVFNENVNRLKKVYGPEAFPPERLRILLEQTNVLNDVEFTKLCDLVIADCKGAPVLRDFLKLGQGVLHLAKERQKSEEDELYKRRKELKKTCPTCDDVGFVSAISKKRKSSTTTAFRCPDFQCLKYSATSQIAERWSQKFSEEFELVRSGETPQDVWLRTWAETPF